MNHLLFVLLIVFSFALVFTGCAYYPSPSSPCINAGKPPVGQYYLTPPPAQPENYYRFRR
ncbi:MAG: hypothetical protein PHX74_06370 [Candidatus Sumerlaeales bacterium]|nr:hypothetical protein [Candidatus Sumerlaeales bacterium]